MATDSLGKWIADYYLAPVGEVFRTMLPLGAEFKRAIGYRIKEEGHGVASGRDVRILRALAENSRRSNRGISRTGISRGT